MSLTKRTFSNYMHTIKATGSASGANTTLTMVFQASNALYGVRGTINVFVNGTKQTCSWTTNRLCRKKWKTGL